MVHKTGFCCSNFPVATPVLVILLSCFVWQAACQMTVTVIPATQTTQILAGNGSINATTTVSTNGTVNGTSIQPNSTTIPPSVVPSHIISQVSNVTATADNVFFLEFKILSQEWSTALTSRTTLTFVLLANEITRTIDEVYSSRNDTQYNGSLVIGYREGVYASVKVQFKRGVSVNVSLMDPLIDYLRSGGSGRLKTDIVFIKLSKYADCLISYVETQVCHCPTKTYKRQIKCAAPDVRGGEICPTECDTGRQVTGTRPCTWDDLDAALCSTECLKPAILIYLALALLNLLLYN